MARHLGGKGVLLWDWNSAGASWEGGLGVARGGRGRVWRLSQRESRDMKGAAEGRRSVYVGAGQRA